MVEVAHTHPRSELAKRLIAELKVALAGIDLTTPFESVTALDIHGRSLDVIVPLLDRWAEEQWRKAMYGPSNIPTEKCVRCGGTGNELLTMYRKCSWCDGRGWVLPL